MARHIGIVAVSAEGAALCYRTICAEAPALLGPHAHPEVTMHTYPLAAYMRHIEAARWDEVATLLLASAEILHTAGAELLVCPDNTVHQAIDTIRDRSPLPWLHIADEVGREAGSRGFRSLLILGTRYLMEGPVYPAVLGPRAIAHQIPDAADRARIDTVIFEELVNQRFEDRARTFFKDVIAKGQAGGADAVALACTEIPLLIGEADSPLPVLDSTRILARSALREAVD
jgi:aspartate racemase